MQFLFFLVDEMKKKAVAFALAMGFGVTQVNAQSFLKKITDNLSGGIKAEANMSGFSLSDMPNAKSTMNIGGTFGWFVKLDVSKRFAVQEDVLLHYKKSTLEQRGVISDYQYWGIEVPIYFMGERKMDNGERFYIGMGPYAEYGISAKYKAIGNKVNLYKKDEINNKAPMTHLAIGAAIIIGYELRNGIQLNAGYKMGLTNVLDLGKDNASMQPNTISIGIGYRF